MRWVLKRYRPRSRMSASGAACGHLCWAGPAGRYLAELRLVCWHCHQSVLAPASVAAPLSARPVTDDDPGTLYVPADGSARNIRTIRSVDQCRTSG